MAEFSNFVDNLKDAATEKCRSVQHLSSMVCDELGSKNDGPAQAAQKGQDLIADMQAKKLLDQGFPKIELSAASNVEKSDSLINLSFPNKISVIEDKKYANTSVSREGDFVAMSWAVAGGKSIEFSNDGHKASIIESRDGGFVMLDEKTHQLTTEDPQGRAKVKTLGTAEEAVVKKTFDHVKNALDFQFNWDAEQVQVRALGNRN